MRVLNVNHTLDPVTGGGTAERTLQMSLHIARAGIYCTILSGKSSFDVATATTPEKLHFVTTPWISKRFFVPLLSWSKLRRLVEEADIIHLMGHWSVINASVYLFARWLRKPYVLCPAGALPIYGRSRLLKHFYNLVVGNRIVRNANAKIAITQDEVAHFNSYGVSSQDVRIIPNGVDADDYGDAAPGAFRTKFGLAEHPFVLFMGRLNSIKGPDLLLAAFCVIKDRFPDLHLVFAGPDDGMRPLLMAATQSAGIAERVHFAGYIGGPDKASAYRAASLLAIPSRQEAMSIVVLEAGIRKTPVLLTDQCGLNIISAHGGNVVPATAEGIAQGLLEMFSDPQSLKSRGESLCKFVRAHYLWGSIVQSYIGLYKQLLNKPAA